MGILSKFKVILKSSSGTCNSEFSSEIIGDDFDDHLLPQKASVHNYGVCGSTLFCPQRMCITPPIAGNAFLLICSNNCPCCNFFLCASEEESLANSMPRSHLSDRVDQTIEDSLFLRGTKRLHLRVESREDKMTWVEVLQTVNDMSPRISNSELMAPVDDLSVSTDNLKQRLLEEDVSVAVILVEEIVKNEFASLQNQLVLLK